MSDKGETESTFPSKGLGLGLSMLCDYGADDVVSDSEISDESTSNPDETSSLSILDGVPNKSNSISDQNEESSMIKSCDFDQKINSELCEMDCISCDDNSVAKHGINRTSEANEGTIQSVLETEESCESGLNLFNESNTDTGTQTHEDCFNSSPQVIVLEQCPRETTFLLENPVLNVDNNTEALVANGSIVSTSEEIFFIDKESRINPYIENFTSDSESDSEISSESSTESVSSSDDEEEAEEEPEPEKRPKKPPPSSHKTKGELSIEDLPTLEDLHISVPETDIHLIGHVRSIVGTQVIIESFLNEDPLDLESVLFLSNGNALGKIFDVFGQVVRPLYSVRFNSKEDINSHNVKTGDPIYSAPGHQDVTIFIFTEALKRERGTDASWEHNNEPPPECLDFSDDEEERAHRQKVRAKFRNGDKKESGDDSATPVRKPRMQESRLPPTHFLRPQKFQTRPVHWNQQWTRPPIPIRTEVQQGPTSQNNFQGHPPPFNHPSGMQTNGLQPFPSNPNTQEFLGPFPPYFGPPHEQSTSNYQFSPGSVFPGSQSSNMENFNFHSSPFPNPPQFQMNNNNPQQFGEPRLPFPSFLGPRLPMSPHHNSFQFQGPPNFSPNGFQQFPLNQNVPQFGAPPPYFGNSA